MLTREDETAREIKEKTKGEENMISKKCWNCEGEIEAKPFATVQYFCCPACRNEYKRENKKKQFFTPFQFTCSQCGRVIYIDDPKDKRSRFCSAECEKKYWKHPPYEHETNRTNFHSLQEYLSWERRTNE